MTSTLLRRPLWGTERLLPSQGHANAKRYSWDLKPASWCQSPSLPSSIRNVASLWIESVFTLLGLKSPTFEWMVYPWYIIYQDSAFDFFLFLLAMFSQNSITDYYSFNYQPHPDYFQIYNYRLECYPILMIHIMWTFSPASVKGNSGSI